MGAVAAGTVAVGVGTAYAAEKIFWGNEINPSLKGQLKRDYEGKTESHFTFDFSTHSNEFLGNPGVLMVPMTPANVHVLTKAYEAATQYIVDLDKPEQKEALGKIEAQARYYAKKNEQPDDAKYIEKIRVDLIQTNACNTMLRYLTEYGKDATFKDTAGREKAFKTATETSAITTPIVGGVAVEGDPVSGLQAKVKPAPLDKSNTIG